MIVCVFGAGDPFLGYQPLERWSPADDVSVAALRGLTCVTSPDYPFLFKRLGEVWALRFEHEGGLETGHYPVVGTVGLRYYAQIIAAYPNPVKALELLEIEDRRVLEDSFSRQEANDKEGLDTLYERSRRLQREIEEAEQYGDKESAAKARDELHRLLELLAKDTRPAEGRPKTVNINHSPDESARKAVYSNLRRARRKVAHDMPLLADHLRRFVTGEGFGFRYAPPDAPIAWVL
jgi:hypothetical protein